jgi:hypothetical protein
VAAHIQERAKFAIAPAHDKDWHAGIIVGTKRTGRRPVRSEAHEKRILAEQDLLLTGKMLRVNVDRGVVPPGHIGKSGSLALNMSQQSLQEIDLCLSIHWRFFLSRRTVQ